MHDIIEDTKYTYNDILSKYGKEIADGVLILSEDQSIENYVERKKKFIKKLNMIDNDLLIIEIVDKLQNLISDYDNFLINGKDSLITEANNYEELKWYYTELQKLFNKKFKNNLLLDRYNEMMKIYFS